MTWSDADFDVVGAMTTDRKKEQQREYDNEVGQRAGVGLGQNRTGGSK